MTAERATKGSRVSESVPQGDVGDRGPVQGICQQPGTPLKPHRAYGLRERVPLPFEQPVQQSRRNREPAAYRGHGKPRISQISCHEPPYIRAKGIFCRLALISRAQCGRNNCGKRLLQFGSHMHRIRFLQFPHGTHHGGGQATYSGAGVDRHRGTLPRIRQPRAKQLVWYPESEHAPLRLEIEEVRHPGIHDPQLARRHY